MEDVHSLNPSEKFQHPPPVQMRPLILWTFLSPQINLKTTVSRSSDKKKRFQLSGEMLAALEGVKEAIWKIFNQFVRSFRLTDISRVFVELGASSASAASKNTVKFVCESCWGQTHHWHQNDSNFYCETSQMLFIQWLCANYSEQRFRNSSSSFNRKLWRLFLLLLILLVKKWTKSLKKEQTFVHWKSVS